MIIVGNNSVSIKRISERILLRFIIYSFPVICANLFEKSFESTQKIILKTQPTINRLVDSTDPLNKFVNAF